MLFTVADGAGRITLNRPRALNALSVAMCGRCTLTDAWASDDAVERVELRGAEDRALCAGADIRALRAAVADGQDWLRFFEIEYALDAAIARYPKPYVACQSGIVMGGGLGVSAHGSRRIVDASSRLACPRSSSASRPTSVSPTWVARPANWARTSLTGDSRSGGRPRARSADEFAGEGRRRRRSPGVWIMSATSVTMPSRSSDASRIPDPDARAPPRRS